MLTGVTRSGFEYVITDDRLNNMELIDAMTDVDETDDNGMKAIIMSKVCRLLLGKEQKKALYDFIREPEGNVPIEKVLDDVMSIIENEQIKN